MDKAIEIKKILKMFKFFVINKELICSIKFDYNDDVIFYFTKEKSNAIRLTSNDLELSEFKNYTIYTKICSDSKYLNCSCTIEPLLELSEIQNYKKYFDCIEQLSKICCKEFKDKNL
jgi:hypothetical protein